VVHIYICDILVGSLQFVLTVPCCYLLDFVLVEDTILFRSCLMPFHIIAQESLMSNLEKVQELVRMKQCHSDFNPRSSDIFNLVSMRIDFEEG